MARSAEVAVTTEPSRAPTSHRPVDADNPIDAISTYAAKLGLLFQITDDLLDVTQTTEVLGKTAGKDERAEKATYAGIYEVDETRRMAERVHDEAIGSLARVGQPTEILYEIANFILTRRF